VTKAAAALHRPAPPDDVVDAFFRAQFDAAKEVQRAAPSKEARFSLEELRAAIGRITRRMARLLVRTSRVDASVALREAHEYLDSSGLSVEAVERLADVHARARSVR
jgi:cyclohexadienyl dehydratase